MDALTLAQEIINGRRITRRTTFLSSSPAIWMHYAKAQTKSVRILSETK